MRIKLSNALVRGELERFAIPVEAGMTVTKYGDEIR